MTFAISPQVFFRVLFPAIGDSLRHSILKKIIWKFLQRVLQKFFQIFLRGLHRIYSDLASGILSEIFQAMLPEFYQRYYQQFLQKLLQNSFLAIFQENIQKVFIWIPTKSSPVPSDILSKNPQKKCFYQECVQWFFKVSRIYFVCAGFSLEISSGIFMR